MLNVDTTTPSTRNRVNSGSFGNLVEFSFEEIDKGLPRWARRSHPIARRHLGAYWKTFTPDLTALSELTVLLCVIIGVTVIVPIVFMLIVPTVTVSLVMLPIGGYVYVRTLVNVARFASAAVNTERRNNTLSLLRAAPLPFREVLLSKGSAAIWRYIEDLNLVILLNLMTSIPLLLILYHALLHNAASPLIVGIIVMIALIVFTIRLFLETTMTAALGMLMGAVNNTRSAAFVSALMLILAYFVIINAARLIPLGAGYTLLIELVIPTVLPIGITLVSLRLTRWLLERD